MLYYSQEGHRLPVTSPLGYELLRYTLSGCGDGVIRFLFTENKLQLLVSIRTIEDKLDDRNDEHAKGEQLFICNHLTTPFSGEGFRPTVSGIPQGQNASSIITPDSSKTLHILRLFHSALSFFIKKWYHNKK